MNDEILAVLEPSPVRRWFAVAVMLVLGGLLFWLAMARPPESLPLRFLLLVLGAGALVMAELIRRATETRIELTDEGMRDGNGRVICAFDNIAGVDKGAFAFKPSNGFLVRLKRADTYAWEPGLWWRMGRRIGVGGVTPAAQAKLMAERIQIRLSGQEALLAQLKEQQLKEPQE
jgi:hypothetical protein